jgi:glycosyltransferase involved in cell wall biosynthesis
LFASSAQRAPAFLETLGKACTQYRAVRWPTRLKHAMWTRLEWPPLERFTGPLDVAHGAFHLLPATRRARRAATIFDLSWLRHPETHEPANIRRHLALVRHAIAKADRLIAISESGKRELIEHLAAPEDRVRVVYGGISIEEFLGENDAQALSTLKKRFGIRNAYFIHLGTLEPRKNLPRLIAAYARVRQRVPDCPQLLLAGQAGWMYEAVFQQIEAYRLAGHVIHSGYLSRADAVCLLRGAYACTYPSLYEGFGLPVLEAMAARIPVLTSNVSSLPEVVGDTGLLVDPENVDAIEAGLMELIDQRDAAILRTAAAYRRAKGFTWEHSAKSLDGVYRELAAEGAR